MLREKFNKNDIGASFAIAVLMTAIVGLVVSLIARIIGIDSKNYALRIVSTAANTLAIGSTAFIYAKMTKANVATATKLKAKPPIAHVGWGCLATLFLITFMTPLNDWLCKLIVLTGLPNPGVDIELDIVSMIILAAVLPAFCEEIVFRGTIASALESNKNRLASLAVCGALFSVFHMNPAQTIHQFTLGAFLALLMLRSGSLWTTVIVHFFNNIVVIALSAIFGDKLNVFFDKNAVWLFFAGLICFAGSVAGYLFTTKSKWQTVSSAEEEPKYTARCFVPLFCAVGVCLLVWIFVLIFGV